MEIRRVVIGFFELVHTLSKERIGVDLVERDARAEDIDQCEALVLNPVLVKLCEVFRLTAEAPRNLTAARGKSQCKRVEHAFEITLGSGLGQHAGLTGR